MRQADVSIGYVSPYGEVIGPRRRRVGPIRSARGVLMVVVAVGVAVFSALQSPGIANADTTGGFSTNGVCVAPGTPIVLWSQNVSGLARIKVKFTLDMRTGGNQPTVVQGGWVLSTGSTWETGYWQNNQLGSGTTTMSLIVGAGVSGVSDIGTGVGIDNGTTGVIRYHLVVRGYDAASCAIVRNVVIERTYWGVAATTPPGGGGFTNPTPTPGVPGATPTPPAAATPIPGATPGPGVVCFPNWAGATECYPQPPVGWCYVTSPFGGGTNGMLVQCGAPTPTPVPNQQVGSCHVSVGSDMSPNTYTKRHECHVSVPGTTTGTGVVTPNYFIPAGSAGRVLRMTITAMSPTNSHDWLIFTNQAGQQSNVSAATTPQNPVGITYCFVMNTSNNVPVPTSSFPAGCIQHASSSVDNEAFAIGSRWCCGNLDTGWQTIRFEMFASIAQFNANGGLAGPTPTPSQALPSNYYGPGNATPPPQGAGGGGEEVDICASNPGILACAGSFPPDAGDICAQYPGIAACATAGPTLGPPGTVDPSAAAEGFTAVYDHLMSKAPFGYVNQVVGALEGTFSGAAAGTAGDWCWDIEIFGGTADACVVSFASDAAPFIRALMLVLVTIVFMLVVFGMTTKAPDGQVD